MEIQAFESWAIVEIMGHKVLAGYCTEATITGATLLRIDVPAVEGQAAFTKFIGASSVYAITPTSEETARIAAAHVRARPVDVWVVPDRPMLEAKSRRPPDNDDTDDDDRFYDEPAL